MASKRKSKSRRKFLIGSGAAALVPTARASAPGRNAKKWDRIIKAQSQ